MARVAAGERAALRELYDATAARLFGACLRILPDREESAEVLQDVYLTVWRRAEAFDASRGPAAAWLAAIARNRAIDRLRARAPLERSADAEGADAVDEAAPELGDALSDEGRRLSAGLDELRPDEAAAIRTAYVHGLTYEGVAARTGEPAGAVKARIRRGLLRLRKAPGAMGASSRSGSQSGRTLPAELALGVLDGAARTRAEARAAADPEFAAEAAAWSARLHALGEATPAADPPAALWARIEEALPAGRATAAPTTRAGPPPPATAEHRALRRWRSLAFGAGAVAAASVVAVLLLSGRQPDLKPILAARLEPPASSQLLMSGALFTVTLDPGRRLAVLTPVSPGPADPRVRELWVMSNGAAPLTAGVIDATRTRLVRLSPELARAASKGAVLAVSLEPKGGAPNGAPTGPVIAQGVLSGV